MGILTELNLAVRTPPPSPHYIVEPHPSSNDKRQSSTIYSFAQLVQLVEHFTAAECIPLTDLI